jgi:serine/threonine protein kinase
MNNQLIGQVLRDRYQIQSLLGRQTGRRTFLAHDLETRSLVVLKFLLFGSDFTWEALKLFEREAETLKSLDHPAIPKYLNSFEVDTELGKGFALVQSYIEARSLQDWVQSGRTFSEEELKVIAKELLGILHYLHSRQPSVIHRDIKPSNILLGDRSGNSPGQLYLVDFGSVQTTRQDGTMTIVGTYGYMPPEQFSGQTTPASDLYALGAMLIYVTTGQHPNELPHQEIRVLFADKVNLSPNLISWLEWMTEPSLELRLKSAKQALEALENANLREGFSAIASKPSYSNVNVTSSRQTLEILIPPKFSVGNLIGMVVGGIMMTLIGGGICSSALQSNHWLSLLLILCFGSIFLFSGLCIFLGILYSLAHQRLRITSQNTSLTHQLFRVISLKKLNVATVAIAKIEPIHLRYKQDSEGSTTAIPPCINLWAGTVKFALGSNQYESIGRLTDQEVNWLAQVLSHWLNLPIVIPSIDSKNSTDQQNQRLPATTNVESTSINHASEDVLSGSSINPGELKINRPLSTSIQLEATPEILEIEVPYNKLKLQEKMCSCENIISVLVFITSFYGMSFVLFSLGLPQPLVLLFFPIILYWLLYKVSLSTGKSKSYHLYKILLQRKDHATVVRLISMGTKEYFVVFQDKELWQISAGFYDTSNYHLKISCRSSDETFCINGDRAEIQWLCDELNEWAGLAIEIQRWQPPSA